MLKRENSEHPYKYFCSLEKEMNMFSLQYENIKYWELIRIAILKRITKTTQTTIDLRQKTPYIQVVIMNCVNTIIQLFVSRKFSNADMVIFRPSTRYPLSKNSRDREFDYAEMEKQYSIVNIYALGEYTGLNKLFFLDLSIPELKTVFWKIRRKIFGTKKIITPSQREKIQIFLNLINDEYNCSIDIDTIENQLEYLLNVHKVYKDYYRKILTKIKPRVVLLSTYYDDHMYPLCYAANELGIKTIELQHGAINAHESYWYEDIEIEGLNLPDYLLTYGDWWNRQIKMPKKEHVIAVGYPFLESKVRPENNRDRYTIAVFSGPEAGVVLSRFIVENIEYFRKNNIRILYKLHPVEYHVWKREYRWLKNCRGIEIIDDERSVYDLLNESDMALAVNTTVLFEATMYSDIKIAVYNKEFIAQMIPLIASGRARLINDIYDLDRFISEKESDLDMLDCEFYKKNASEETKKVLNGIFNH